MAKLNAKDFIASLNEMNLLEIKELVDAMKEEFGVDPSAVAVAAPAAGTYYYTFIWGMAGENLYYNDKDNIPVIDIR